MEKKGNAVNKIDKVILVGTVVLFLVTLVAFMLTANSFGSNNRASSNTLFSFKSGSVILIDSNINFRFPERIVAKDNLVIIIRNGTYYWKIEDAIPEDVIELNITEPVVNLKLKKSEEGYNVVNYNNGTLNVDMYRKDGLTGTVILENEEDNEVSGVVYVGGKNG